MKYKILLLLLFFMSCKAHGQNKARTLTTSRTLTKQDYGIFGTVTSSTTVTLARNDTVSAIMLCADTSLKTYIIPSHYEFHVDSSLGNVNGTYAGWDVFTPEYEEQRYETGLYWQRGYSVSSLAGYMYYLDDNKKPIPKNIMVWMSVSDLISISRWTDASNASRDTMIITKPVTLQDVFSNDSNYHVADTLMKRKQ
jgi:hypothetical protein